MTFSQFQEQFHISLDPQQSAAVQAVEGPVLLLAVPGSGKTTALVTRIGYLCYALGVLPEQIITMTYTVSAAREYAPEVYDGIRQGGAPGILYDQRGMQPNHPVV